MAAAAKAHQQCRQTTPGNTLPNVHTPMRAGRARSALSTAPILLFLVTGRTVHPPSLPPACTQQQRCHPAAACKPAPSTQPCSAQCACKPPLDTAHLSCEIQTPNHAQEKRERECVCMFSSSCSMHALRSHPHGHTHMPSSQTGVSCSTMPDMHRVQHSDGQPLARCTCTCMSRVCMHC